MFQLIFELITETEMREVKSKNIFKHVGKIPYQKRWEMLGSKGFTIWFTGSSETVKLWRKRKMMNISKQEYPDPGNQPLQTISSKI